MHRGYIKIWRKMLDWEWGQDLRMIGALVFFISEANHRPAKFKGTGIARGQFIGGRDELSARMGLTVREFRTIVTRLKTTSEMTSISTSRGTLYTIVNYDKYQDLNDIPTSETTSETTAERPATDQRPTTPKNNKELKNKNTIDPGYGFEAFWKACPKKVGKHSARKAWEKKGCAAIATEVTNAMCRHKTSEDWRKDDGKFIPHPATWLNAGRWEDDLGGAAATPKWSKPKPLPDAKPIDYD